MPHKYCTPHQQSVNKTKQNGLILFKNQNLPANSLSSSSSSSSSLSLENGRPRWWWQHETDEQCLRGHVESGESSVADEVPSSRLSLLPRPSLRPVSSRRQSRCLYRPSQLQRRRFSSSGSSPFLYLQIMNVWMPCLIHIV